VLPHVLQAYAFLNRQMMLGILLRTIREVSGAQPDEAHAVNIHHNFCALEHCTFKVSRTASIIRFRF
jgi:hypothetical protein